ncbi:hypothetical protein BDV59DRAFT_188804 [Aspergillus ambiguus]|uniref:uncharacterized protein n=1 Tax=Aspergillus ambiguus TaxID=176160 RepID=UPI003CCDEA0D
MHSVFYLALLATSFVAASRPPSLMAREISERSCPDGRKPCGPGCIPTDWTCCPGALGGCAPTEYCSSPTFCCPLGETCTEEGGVSTILDNTVTRTRTRTNVITHTGTSSDEATAVPAIPTSSLSSSRPVIPTASGSSNVTPTPTPSSSSTSSTTASATLFTGGAVSNLMPVGFGAVAGVVGAAFL